MEGHGFDVDRRVLKRYRPHNVVGQGSYGTVYKASDRRSGRVVALKKVIEAFRNSHDALATYREVMVLQQLRHPNIVRLREVIRAENDKDIYLIFEFMESDLLHVVRSGQLEEIHKRSIFYQVLKGLYFLHSAEVLHRDVKPANILIDSSGKAKLADFGEARSLLTPVEGAIGTLTGNAATLWYNSPEVLVGSSSYSKPTDMWSAGCVLGFMLGERPVFPGTSYNNQLTRMIDLVGIPGGAEDIEALQSDHAVAMLSSMPDSSRMTFRDLYPKASDGSIDLLGRLLVFNPSKRATALEALQSPWLEDHFVPDRDLVKAEDPVRLEFDHLSKLPAITYREALYTRLGLGTGSLQSQVSSGSSPIDISQSVTQSPPASWCCSASPVDECPPKSPMPSNASSPSERHPSHLNIPPSPDKKTERSPLLRHQPKKDDPHKGDDTTCCCAVL